MGHRKIAKWLRESGYKAIRGKRFFSNHVYSILKRKRERHANQNQEVQTEYRDFYLEFIERKLINSDKTPSPSPFSPPYLSHSKTLT